jgi:hypothetical protein
MDIFSIYFVAVLIFMYVVVDERIKYWWITPVSTLFAINMIFAIQVS